MSNVISIHGYTIVHHNGEPMIEDLALGMKLGYERPRKVRDLIKRMLEAGTLKPEQVRSTVGRLSNGAESVSFHLGEKAALKVITKSETAAADAITDEIIDVFIDVRSGKTEAKPKQRYVDPAVAQNRLAVEVAKSTMQLGKLLGADVPMARAIAAERVKKETGIDCAPLLARNAVEEAPVTPTELGKAHGLSGVKMNAKLEEAGLQKKVGKSWEPTDKAKEHCTINPFKSEHSDHSGYQLKWYPRVLEMFDVLKARESAQ